MRDTGPRGLSREGDWRRRTSSGVLGILLPCGLQLEKTLLHKGPLFNSK